MENTRFAPQRRDRWRRPGTFVLGRCQGNAFIPWADLETRSCASVANLRPPQPVQTPSSLEASSAAPSLTERSASETAQSKSFIPSVNENYYTAEEKAQALYLPPLYGQSLFYAYKHHEIKIEPLNAVFKGRNFPFLVLRNLLQSLGPYLEYWKKQAEEEHLREDSDDEDEVPRERLGPPPDLHEQLDKCWVGVVREVSNSDDFSCAVNCCEDSYLQYPEVMGLMCGLLASEDCFHSQLKCHIFMFVLTTA